MTIPKSNISNNKSIRDTLNLPEIKLGNSMPVAKQMSNQFSSLFSGLPLQTNAFPSLVDMSSTQALVALAKLAKEAEEEQVLRGTKKTPPKPKVPSSIAQHLASPLSSSSSLLSGNDLSQLPLGTSAATTTIHPHAMNNNTSTTLASSSTKTSEISTPLDLSSSQIYKKIKISPNQQATFDKCRATSDEINSWTVEQVCEFVGNIDICAEYVQVIIHSFI